MSSREKLLLTGLILIALVSGAFLYFQRPEASGTTPPQARLELTTGAALRGSEGNTAVLESVVVEEDGTIELAPLSE